MELHCRYSYFWFQVTVIYLLGHNYLKYNCFVTQIGIWSQFATFHIYFKFQVYFWDITENKERDVRKDNVNPMWPPHTCVWGHNNYLLSIELFFLDLNKRHSNSSYSTNMCNLDTLIVPEKKTVILNLYLKNR